MTTFRISGFRSLVARSEGRTCGKMKAWGAAPGSCPTAIFALKAH
jgi:hypothetical protein